MVGIKSMLWSSFQIDLLSLSPLYAPNLYGGKNICPANFFFIAILESDYKRTRSVCRPTALPSNLENEAQQLYSKNLQKVYQKDIFKSRQRHYVHKLPTKICVAIGQQELLYTKDTNTYSSNDLWFTSLTRLFHYSYHQGMCTHYSLYLFPDTSCSYRNIHKYSEKVSSNGLWLW